MVRELSETDDDLLLGAETAPGGVIVYYADGDEEILHANRYVVDLFECDSFEDFMELTGGSFKGFVHEDDRAVAEDSIWGQVGEQGSLDHIYYRVRTKTGRLVSIDDYGRLIRRAGKRPIFVVFVVEMDRLSAIDWLTGLPGMDRFRFLLGCEAQAMEARSGMLAVAAFDLMGMRFYNARHGRGRGDALLKAFADTLRTCFGSEASCRASGDSFFAFCAREEADERIQAVFDKFASVRPDDALPIMAGATTLEEGDGLSLTMDRARFACYTDRTTWESHLTWYTSEMRASALLRVYVLERVEQAIEEGWVVPYYQAVVRTSTGAICHEEALARWIDPEYGPLSPAQFIPALEEAGQLLKLDLCIVDRVLADMGERARRGVPVVPVSVNLSLRDLGQVDIAHELVRRVDAAGVPRELLRIEFTESAASTDPALLRSQVQCLHEAGFSVWMDDFGSGYSSLNALGEFDFDLVKLDRGFIAQGSSARRSIVMDAVVRATKRMGIATLAEGIETQEQALLLAELGCDMLQGFLYARPQPIGQIMDEYLAGTSRGYEPLGEEGYWRAIGSVSLPDIASNGEGKGVSETPVSEFPAGVIECERGVWRPLRANEPLRAFLVEHGLLAAEDTVLSLSSGTVDLGESFQSAIRRSDQSGGWERISGTLERGSGFQFHVCPLVRCERASAYLVASTPTLLGSALGSYGDVPVAYAVLRVELSDDGSAAEDLEFVYANERYRTWSGLGSADYAGRRMLEAAGEEGRHWLEPCYRAAVLGQDVHEVSYNASAGHWLSIDIAPTPMAGHCILAFSLADAEQREREELERAGTRDALTGLYSRRGFDRALSARMAQAGASFALAIIDVDDLTQINELYGHAAGDRALRCAADALRRAFPPATLIGRNSRGEMVAAAFGNGAMEIENILSRLTKADLRCDLGGHVRPLSVSGGYTWCDGTTHGLKAAFTRASRALAEVRDEGRSGYLRWVPAMEEAPRQRLLGYTTRELAAGMPLAMIAHRADGQILVANKGLAHMLGYPDLGSTLTAIGHRLEGFVHPEDWPRLAKSIARLVEAHPDEDERNIGVRVVTATGEALEVAYRARVARPDGSEPVFYAYMVDTGVADTGADV